MIPKFRAWHIEKKIMCFVCELHFTRNLAMEKNIAGIIIPGTDYGGFFSFDESKLEIILMQSTGITDKKGKEIFEDDIVKTNLNIHPERFYDGEKVLHTGRVKRVYT